ncbi:hypothetical protein [Frankia tisae]|uniref:hypothetical protein n=1 Tax=Frankia tisae TaxID=2950104 RepID=UPI0021BE788D|nr:hypothetical protein [Frankia tisae]
MSNERKFQLIRLWNGPAQPVFESVRGLVAAGDRQRLEAMRHGGTPLHEILGARETALRGIAAFALALVDEEWRGDHLAEGLRWIGSTHAFSRTAADGTLVRRPPPQGSGPGAALLSQLDANRPESLPAWSLLCHLTDLPPAAERTTADRKGVGKVVKVTGLADTGQTGTQVTLRLSLDRGLGPGLVPDFRTMAFFRADEEFGRALADAWGLAGREHFSCGLRWSLETADGPLAYAGGPSLGAAMTVLLDELHLATRRGLSTIRVRRLSARTAIVGAVSPASGTLVRVDGYASKLEAVDAKARVIVPIGDKEEALNDADGHQIVPVRTWRQAARKSRNLDRQHFLRLALTVAVVLGVTAGSSLYYVTWSDGLARRAALRAAAVNLATKARDLDARSDSEGRGLLLAMASDDLAAKAGERTDVFGELAVGHSTLRRILQPSAGAYEDSALSPGGTYGLLSASAGEVSIVSMRTGEKVWSRQLPPGNIYSPDQVRVWAMAFSADGKAAAIATSDRRITVLRRSDTRWTEQPAVTIPIPSVRSGFIERNIVNALAFDDDGQHLIAFSDDSGSYRVDLTGATGATRCDPAARPAAKDISALAASPGKVLIATAHQVTELDAADCALTPVLTAPSTTELVGVGRTAKGIVTAVGTDGARLLALDRAGSRLISDRGPFTDVDVYDTGDGLMMSATWSTLSTIWNLENGKQVAGMPGRGTARAAAGLLLWTHDAVAEVHDQAGSFAVRQYYPVEDVRHVGWVGSSLVVGRGGGGVDVIPRPAEADGLQRSYPLPHAAGALHTLVTDPGGSMAAAIVGGTVISWDVEHRRTMPVPVAGGEVARSDLAFAHGKLYLADLDGRIEQFTMTGGRWTRGATMVLPGRIYALAADEASDSLVALIGSADGQSGTIVRIGESDLAVQAERAVAGPLGLGAITALPNRQIVAAYGAGTMVFLGPDLQIRGTLTVPGHDLVLGLYQVPGQDELVVAGPRLADLVAPTTQTLLNDGTARLRTAVALGASADGDFLATASYLHGNLMILASDPIEVRRRACGAIGRDLSREEWTQYVGDKAPYRPVCSTEAIARAGGSPSLSSTRTSGPQPSAPAVTSTAFASARPSTTSTTSTHPAVSGSTSAAASAQASIGAAGQSGDLQTKIRSQLGSAHGRYYEIAVTNTSARAITIRQVRGQNADVGTDCPTGPLAAGASCLVKVSFQIEDTPPPHRIIVDSSAPSGPTTMELQ